MWAACVSAVTCDQKSEEQPKKKWSVNRRRRLSGHEILCVSVSFFICFFTRTNDDKKINKNIVFEQFYVYVIHWGFVTNVDTRNMKVDESVLYGVELFDKLKLCSNISYHRWISPLYTTYFIEHLAQFNNRNRWIVTCLLLSIRAIIDVLVLLFSIFLSVSCTTITVTLPLWSRHQRKFSVHIRNW